MDDIFSFTDEFGPAKIIHIHEPGAGLKAIVVIDNAAAGPGIGGVRLVPDVSVEEAFRLARAMTFKAAAAGLPHGGAKAVIFGDPQMPAAEKEKLIRAFAVSIRGLKDYIPGPDMGTDEACMAGSMMKLAARLAYLRPSAAYRSTKLARPHGASLRRPMLPAPIASSISKARATSFRGLVMLAVTPPGFYRSAAR